MIRDLGIGLSCRQLFKDTDDRSRRYYFPQMPTHATMDVSLHLPIGGYTCDIRQLPNQYLSRLDLWLSSTNIRSQRRKSTDECDRARPAHLYCSKRKWECNVCSCHIRVCCDLYCGTIPYVPTSRLIPDMPVRRHMLEHQKLLTYWYSL